MNRKSIEENEAINAITLLNDITTSDTSLVDSGAQDESLNTFLTVGLLNCFIYIIVYLSRLGKDVVQSIKVHFYGEKVLPKHIVKLLEEHRELHENNMDFFSKKRDDRIENYVSSLQYDNQYMIAAEMGHFDRVTKYLQNDKSLINIRNHLGQNALHLAVVSGNEKLINLLIKSGIEICVKDNLSATPLSLCLFRSPSIKIAKLLFDNGAFLLPRATPADTGLFLQFVMMCVPTDDDAKILELLLENGAIINDPDAPGGRQALHFAAMSNNCILIRVLVDLGADLHMQNHRNETPKDVAFTFRCKEAYHLLKQMEEMTET